MVLCMLLLTACGGKGKGGDITDEIPLNVIDDNYRTYYEVFVYFGGSRYNLS